MAMCAVVLIFVVLGSLIALKTPAYESADEVGHVQNVESLVAGHWYGMRCEAGQPSTCSGDEAQQAPLYYMGLAAWQTLVGVPPHGPFVGQRNLAFFDQAKPEIFLHHSDADHRFLLWLRFPNVLLGALTVLFVYFSLRLVTRDRWTPVVAAAMVAFLPRFVFLSSFVTNDNLVDLLGAVLVFLAVRFSIAPSRWRMVWVGAVFGLLITTKLSTLPLGLAVVALAFVVSGWRRRAGYAVIGLSAALVVSGWYLIQNTVRYGDPSAGTATLRYLNTTISPAVRELGLYNVRETLRYNVVDVPHNIIASFWYQSGTNQFFWPWRINVLITVVVAASILCLIGRHVSPRTLLTLGSFSVAGLLSVWFVASQTYTYQARYAFVALVAIFGLAALGLERFHKVAVRFVVPLAGLIGTIVAIQQDVLSVHWT
jgi:hypothetical protein